MNKKIFASIIVVLTLLFILTGCSKENQPQTANPVVSNADASQTVSEQADSLSKDIADFDKLSQDLSVDELDNIDQQLADAQKLETP